MPKKVIYSETNAVYPKSQRRRTTTNLTGVTKGMTAPGINTDIRRVGSNRSSYRKR